MVKLKIEIMPGKKRRKEGPGGFSGTKVKLERHRHPQQESEFYVVVSHFEHGQLLFEMDGEFDSGDDAVSFEIEMPSISSWDDAQNLDMLVDRLDETGHRVTGLSRWIQEWLQVLGSENYIYDLNHGANILYVSLKVKALLAESIDSTPINQWAIVGLPFDLYAPSIVASHMMNGQWSSIEREVILGVYQRSMYDDPNWNVIDLQGFYEKVLEYVEHPKIAEELTENLFVNPSAHNLSTEHLKKSEIAPEEVVKILVETIQAFGEYQLVFYQGEYHAIDVG